jgi:hypothetical protein
MAQKLTLYPIYRLADNSDDTPFNTSLLPFKLLDDLAVEEVIALFDDNTFFWAKDELGRRDVEALKGVRYEGPDDNGSERLVRTVAAATRLIRPTRQIISLIRGSLTNDGKFDVQQFEHPLDLLEIPEVQKLFHIRAADLDVLKAILPTFLLAMAGEYRKFRMAVDFHEAGYFQDWYWKARFTLWCSAIESLYTSNKREHRGSLVAKERIKWFLGGGTNIYEPGDFPNFMGHQTITIEQVVDDLYTLRNHVAHGDRIPDAFDRSLRQGLRGPLNVMQVLHEATSFIIRKTLLRIIRDNLLNHFMDAASSEAYFGPAGLTLTSLRNQQQSLRVP